MGGGCKKITFPPMYINIHPYPLISSPCKKSPKIFHPSLTLISSNLKNPLRINTLSEALSISTLKLSTYQNSLRHATFKAKELALKVEIPIFFLNFDS